MKPRFLSLTVSLIVVSLASACSSSAPPNATTTATQTLKPVESPTASEALPTSTVPPTPVQAVATSRGPNLEATDPNTVSLASGQLQLVEFFRFT